MSFKQPPNSAIVEHRPWEAGWWIRKNMGYGILKTGFRHQSTITISQKKMLIGPHTSWAFLARCNPLLFPLPVENYQA